MGLIRNFFEPLATTQAYSGSLGFAIILHDVNLFGVDVSSPLFHIKLGDIFTR